MKASETRALAREKLAGKWGKAAIAALVFAVVTYIISFVLNLIPVIGSIISLVITVPLSFGFLVTMFKLNDNEEITYLGFLSNGFSNFGKAWSVTLQTLLRLIIPIILIIIAAIIMGATTSATLAGGNSIWALLGLIIYIAALVFMVIKSLSYSFALYVLNDNPDMTGKKAVEKSAELMQGKIWSLICLNLSFIGWSILASFTLGIGLLWLIPYMQVAQINFYRNLIGE